MRGSPDRTAKSHRPRGGKVLARSLPRIDGSHPAKRKDFEGCIQDREENISRRYLRATNARILEDLVEVMLTPSGHQFGVPESTKELADSFSSSMMDADELLVLAGALGGREAYGHAVHQRGRVC